jgi:hypothetical protein
LFESPREKKKRKDFSFSHSSTSKERKRRERTDILSLHFLLLLLVVSGNVFFKGQAGNLRFRGRGGSDFRCTIGGNVRIFPGDFVGALNSTLGILGKAAAATKIKREETIVRLVVGLAQTHVRIKNLRVLLHAINGQACTAGVIENTCDRVKKTSAIPIGGIPKDPIIVFAVVGTVLLVDALPNVTSSIRAAWNIISAFIQINMLST